MSQHNASEWSKLLSHEDLTKRDPLRCGAFAWRCDCAEPRSNVAKSALPWMLRSKVAQCALQMCRANEPRSCLL
jgi:hypothetical protein